MEDRVMDAALLEADKRGPAFQKLITMAMAKGDRGVRQLFRALLVEAVPLSASRPALDMLAAALAAEETDADMSAQACHYILEQLSSRAGAFPTFEYAIRKHLAAHLSEQEEHAQAARVLAALNATDGRLGLTNGQAAEHYVRIAELFLEEDMTVDAQTYVKKASEVVHDTTDAHLKLRFRVSYARIQDSQRKFLEAALKYYQISQIQDDSIDEDDLITLLVHAVKCACLAKAGPQRSRMMDTLHRDARTPAVEGYFMLDKMYRQQIVRSADVERFRELLMPHQVASLGGGMTVYDRAVVQHNMLAASRIYECITFEELAVLLNISPAKAETIAATMIAEDRLTGTIDQVEGLLVFEQGKEVITSWDAALKQICASVNRCCDEIAAKYPELHAAAVASAAPTK